MDPEVPIKLKAVLRKQQMPTQPQYLTHVAVFKTITTLSAGSCLSSRVCGTIFILKLYWLFEDANSKKKYYKEHQIPVNKNIIIKLNCTYNAYLLLPLFHNRNYKHIWVRFLMEIIMALTILLCIIMLISCIYNIPGFWCQYFNMHCIECSDDNI